MTGTRRLTAVLTICVLAAAGASAADPADPTVTIDTTLFPKNLADGQSSKVVVTIDASQSVSGAVLALDPPIGCAVQPPAVSLPTFNRKLVNTAVLSCQDAGKTPDGDYPLIVRLSTGSGSAQTVIASQTVTFSYASQIPSSVYLWLGALGIAFGYGIRFFVTVLKSIPPPSPLRIIERMEREQAPGPITRWVATHYYFVDFVVTLTIGFIVLVVLMQGTHPPTTASSWPHALTLGVSLGLLTNSDLITRIK